MKSRSHQLRAEYKTNVKSDTHRISIIIYGNMGLPDRPYNNFRALRSGNQINLGIIIPERRATDFEAPKL